MNSRNRNDETADAMTVGLVSSGLAYRIGIPYWIASEIITSHRRDRQTEILIGMPVGRGMFGRGFAPLEVMAEFAGMHGYMFSWGSISERHVSGGTDAGLQAEKTVVFEVLLDHPLEQDPDPSYWKPVLTALANVHPQASQEFRATEGAHQFHAIRFQATGLNAPSLRTFLVETFLPRILPDVLEQADRLLLHRPMRRTVTKKSDGRVTRRRQEVLKRYYGRIANGNSSRH